MIAIYFIGLFLTTGILTDLEPDDVPGNFGVSLIWPVLILLAIGVKIGNRYK